VDSIVLRDDFQVSKPVSLFKTSTTKLHAKNYQPPIGNNHFAFVFNEKQKNGELAKNAKGMR